MNLNLITKNNLILFIKKSQKKSQLNVKHSLNQHARLIWRTKNLVNGYRMDCHLFVCKMLRIIVGTAFLFVCVSISMSIVWTLTHSLIRCKRFECAQTYTLHTEILAGDIGNNLLCILESTLTSSWSSIFVRLILSTKISFLFTILKNILRINDLIDITRQKIIVR